MPTSTSFFITKITMKQPKRFFLPCQQWVYFKIYCSELSADRILKNELENYITGLHHKKLVKNWFFIRYHDPDHHIRLRLELKKDKYCNVIVQRLNKALKKLVEDNYIWNIEIGSYGRELERYSFLDYRMTEQLFHIDSTYYLKSVALLKCNELKFLYNFKSSLDFIKLFYHSDSELLNFIKSLEQSFKQEFKTTKITQKQLSTKYRTLRENINEFLDNTKDNNYSVLRNLLSKRLIQINSVLDIDFPTENSNQKFDFVSGHIHMNTNRTFSTNQRLYEMITYDHLFRYCNSRIQRNKKKNAEK
jgi:thiopeptide-type bacteriocin biosynthesis protein